MESVNTLAAEQINEEVYTFSPVATGSTVILDTEKSSFNLEIKNTNFSVCQELKTLGVLIPSSLHNLDEFEQIWNLEKQIFADEFMSTKEDLREIYDTREILIMSPNGYVIANPLEDVPREEASDVNWGKGNTLYIFSIGVIPQAKGMGLGKTMLQQVINDSKKPRIALDTTNDVMKQLCLKLGFKQISDTYFVFEKGIVDFH